MPSVFDQAAQELSGDASGDVWHQAASDQGDVWSQAAGTPDVTPEQMQAVGQFHAMLANYSAGAPLMQLLGGEALRQSQVPDLTEGELRAQDPDFQQQERGTVHWKTGALSRIGIPSEPFISPEMVGDALSTIGKALFIQAPTDQTAMGVKKGVSNLVSGLTTPSNLALGAAIPFAPEAAAPLVSGYFGKEMLQGAGEEGIMAYLSKTPQERAEHITGALGSAAFAGLAGLHIATAGPKVDPITETAKTPAGVVDLQTGGPISPLREKSLEVLAPQAITPEPTPVDVGKINEQIAALRKETVTPAVTETGSPVASTEATTSKIDPNAPVGQSNLTATIAKNVADARMMRPGDPEGFLRDMAQAARDHGLPDKAANFEAAADTLKIGATENAHEPIESSVGIPEKFSDQVNLAANSLPDDAKVGTSFTGYKAYINRVWSQWKSMTESDLPLDEFKSQLVQSARSGDVTLALHDFPPPESLPEGRRSDLLSSTTEHPAETRPFHYVQVREDVKPIKTPAVTSEPESATTEPSTPEPPRGAPPSSTVAPNPEPQGQPLGIRNAIVDSERQRLGLPPAMQSARLSDPVSWDAAMARIEADPDAASKLEDSLQANPRAPNKIEEAMLAHRQTTLETEHLSASDAVNKAHDAGDDAAKADAQFRKASAMDKLQRLYDVTKSVGTESGRSLQGRKLLVNRDYTLASMLTERRAAKGGEPLTPKEGGDVENQFKEWQSAKADYESKIAGLEEKNRQLAAAKAVTDLTSEVKAEAKAAKPKSKIAQFGENALAKFKQAEDAARERLKAKGGRLFSGVDPTTVSDVAIIGASKLAHLAGDVAKWTASMIEEFGERIRPHLAALLDSAKAKLEASSKVADLSSKLAARVSDGEGIDTLHPLVRAVAKEVVRGGARGWEDVTNGTHEVVKDIVPGVTPRETMDAISGYGRTSELSKDEVSAALRDAAGQAQQVAKIQDMQAGSAPRKTGPERRVPSAEERALIKEVNNLKKKGGFEVTDPEKQLKTALGAVKTRLQNQIDDLSTAISKREALPPKTGSIEYDQEAKDLRARRDELKAQYESIFKAKDSELTEAKQVASLQKSIADLERRIKEGDVLPRSGKLGPDSERVAALKAQRDALAEQLQKLRAGPKLSPDEVRLKMAMTAAEKSAADWQQRLDNAKKKGVFYDGTKRPTRATTPELDAIRARRDAAKAEVEHLRETDTAQQELAKSKSLDERIAATEEKLKKPVPATPEKPLGPETDSVAAKKARLEALQKQQAERVKAARAMTPAERMERQEATQQRALQKQIDDLKDDIAKGNLDPKRTEPKLGPDTEATSKLKSDLSAMKAQREKAREVTGVYVRADLARRKAALAAREADLKARLARGDFSKRSKPIPRVDPEVLALQARVAKAQQDFQRGNAVFARNNRTYTAKFLDTITELNRARVLSGLSTMEKLSAAVTSNIFLHPLEEATGGVMGKVPGISHVFEQAPIEGGLNVRAIGQGVSDSVKNLFKNFNDYRKTGQMHIDLNFGEPHTEAPKLLEVFGRWHGALKTAARQYQFTTAFEKGMKHAVDHGENPLDGNVILKVGTEAYNQASRSILTDNNIVVDAYKAAIKVLEREQKSTGRPNAAGQVIAAGLKGILPVVRIPTNLAARVLEYGPLGLATGLGRTAYERIIRGVNDLPPAQADSIARNLKRGLIGTAFMSIGYFNPNIFGGYYAGKEPQPKDPQFGGAKIGGHNIPRILLHNPLLEQFQIGATIRRVSDSFASKRSIAPQGLGSGVKAAAKGVAAQVPFIGAIQRFGRLMEPNSPGLGMADVGAGIIPRMASEIAEHQDVDAQGNPIKRSPTGFWQGVKSEIPGVTIYGKEIIPSPRKTVPTKEAALSASRSGS